MLPNERPLVVDLDGTLIRNDLLHDSLLFIAIRRPSKLGGLIKKIVKGKSSFKDQVARIYVPRPEHVVFNSEVLELIRESKLRGTKVFLVSASTQTAVTSISENLGIFDDAMGSRDTNLKGQAKADFLISRFGKKAFDYVGNSKSDLPVWAAAAEGYIVSKSKRLQTKAGQVNQKSHILNSNVTKMPLLRELRVHQWVKNLLVFVPLLTAYKVSDLELVKQGILAFLSFSLLASAIYVINDLADINSDREHEKKRTRPVAAAIISVPSAVLLAIALISAGLFAAISVNLEFVAVAVTYLLLTSAYSFFLKQVAVLDCVVLAILYSLRIVAGGLATGISLTYWLLTFSGFLFFSLAWMKRYAEVSKSTSQYNVPGRSYAKGDMPFIFALGMGSALLSILVFVLYIENGLSNSVYEQPELPWLAVLALTFWLGRIWLVSFRGLMHEDPIAFALKDRVSLFCGLLVFASLAVAHLGIPEWVFH